ncbi:MAG: glycosyltransferase [Alphaproteobacteria bacterium]|nr:glycosyltransferase [Alphaproteobacteria bacterium]
MAFLIYDYSNTHIFHRKALLNAIEKVNSKARSPRKLTVIVSTRNMVKALPAVMLGRIKPVLNIVGFGRLYSDYGAVGRAIFNIIIRLYAWRSCAGFIVEHDVDKDCLERLGVGPVFTTHGSGLDVDGFTRRRPERGDRLKVGYLSRFDDSKGSHQVLKAARNWPRDRQLIVAGWDIKGDRYSRAFSRLADDGGITFLGKLSSRQEVSAFFNSIDVFLSPSAREGGNISLQEAIWHGVPFITTDAPGCQVLAERFNCPAVTMDDFANAILADDLGALTPDTSSWPELLNPFMTTSVEDELTEILTEIDRQNTP